MAWGFEEWGKGLGKTGWGGTRKGTGSELGVALAISKSFWEKRGSAQVRRAMGEMQSPSIPC